MKSLEGNKIAAAVLLAGIVALGTEIIASQIFSDGHHGDDHHDERAYPIEGVEIASAPTDAKPAGPEPIAALLQEANAEEGLGVAKKCAICHSFDEGGANKVGPNLYNIVGAPLGKVGGFSYSSALTSKGGEWDYAALNHFLWKPQDYISGTKMAFAGLKKPEDRAAVIAYLRSLSASPQPLPEVTAEEEPAADKEGAETSPAREAPEGDVTSTTEMEPVTKEETDNKQEGDKDEVATDPSEDVNDLGNPLIDDTNKDDEDADDEVIDSEEELKTPEKMKSDEGDLTKAKDYPATGSENDTPDTPPRESIQPDGQKDAQ